MNSLKEISDIRRTQKRNSRIVKTIIGVLFLTFLGIVLYLFILIKQFEKENEEAKERLDREFNEQKRT